MKDVKTNSINEENDLAFAIAIATVGGVEPSEDAKEIIRLYSRGDIDYETAQLALIRMYDHKK